MAGSNGSEGDRRYNHRYRCLVCLTLFQSPRSVVLHFTRAHPSLLPPWFWWNGSASVGRVYEHLLSLSLVAENGDGSPLPAPVAGCALTERELKKRVEEELLRLISRARSSTVEVAAVRLAEAVYRDRRVSNRPPAVQSVVHAALEMQQLDGWNIMVRVGSHRRRVIVLTKLPPEEAREWIPGPWVS